MPKFKVGDRVMHGYFKTAIVNKVYDYCDPPRYAINNYNFIAPENALSFAYFPLSQSMSKKIENVVRGAKNREVIEVLDYLVVLVNKYSDLCDRKDKSSNEMLDSVLAKHRKEVNQLTRLLFVCFVTNVVLLGFLLQEIF